MTATTIKLILACVASSCTCDSSADDANILFMFNGEAQECAPAEEALLYLYGGAKAHTFVVEQNDTIQNNDDTISYLFGGDEPVDTDAELATYLFGGDQPTLATPEQPAIGDAEIMRYIYGELENAPTSLPSGQELAADDVAIMDRNNCMHGLTEWSPSESYAEGKWMLDANIQAENSLMRFLLGSNIPAHDDVAQVADFLYGGAIAPTGRSPLLHDVDLVVAHASPVGERHLDMVELVDLADAADSELAEYLFGGVQQADATQGDEDLADYLYGGQAASASAPEQHLADRVSDLSEQALPDLISLVERDENEIALFLMGVGSSGVTTTEPSTEVDLVDLVVQVDAVETNLANYILGGDANSDAVPSTAGEMESDMDTIGFLYDGAGGYSDASLADYLFGGDEVDRDDTDAALFMYSHGAAHIAPTASTAGTAASSDDDVIRYTMGGNSETVGANDDVILFLLGGSSFTQETFKIASESISPVAKQSLPPAPYTKEQNEDCSDHECITRTLAKLQAEFGISNEMLDEAGIIWGEDMVEYCESATKQEEECTESEKHCPTANTRATPLPSSYSSLRPPSIATCKQVLLSTRSMSTH